jgi:hypothetical protein
VRARLVVLVALGCAAAACGLATVGTGPDVSDVGDGGDGGGTSDATALEGSVIADAASPEGGGSDGASDGDASLDAGIDAGPIGPTLLQTAQVNQGGVTSLPTPVTATHAGSFIAVIVSQDTNANTRVVSVSDNATGGGSTYVSTGIHGVPPICNQAVEIWYARSAKAGATSITVTMQNSVYIDVWIAEVAGLSADGGADDVAADAGGAMTTFQGPIVTPSGVPALIVAAAGSCGQLTGLHPGSLYTQLPGQHGNGAALLLDREAGANGPIFDNANAGWSAATAAFR